MKFKKQNLTLALVALVLVVAIGSAVTFEGAVAVDQNTCRDTDFGLNFTKVGSINFTINQTFYGPLTDFCMNNTTVYEFACSNNLPALNVTDYALLATENCQFVLNNLNATCLNGKCIL